MWQETLLTIQDFQEYCNKCDHQCSTYPTICREKAQAEKSWHARDTEIEEARKAGMREVVEYASHLIYKYTSEGAISRDWKGWQKQLKSWGLEG